MIKNSLPQLQEHSALKDPSAWNYLNEGSNNVILRYTGKYDERMSNLVLRIKKSNNQEFYNSPIQMPEQEYNTIVADNVFSKDPILSKHLEIMHMVKIEEVFL